MPHQLLDDNFGLEKTEDKAALLNKELQKIKFMCMFFLFACLLLFAFLQFFYSEKIIAYAAMHTESSKFDGNSFFTIGLFHTSYLVVFLLCSIILMSIINSSVRKLVFGDVFDSESKYEINSILISLFALMVAIIFAWVVIGLILALIGLFWIVVLGILEAVYRLFFGGAWVYYKYEVEISILTTAPLCFYFLYYEWAKILVRIEK